MTYVWRAEIHVWPHSTGRGQEGDQAEVGGRVQVIDLNADTIDAALDRARLFAKGICTNPKVWQAPIFKLERV